MVTYLYKESHSWLRRATWTFSCYFLSWSKLITAQFLFGNPSSLCFLLSSQLSVHQELSIFLLGFSWKNLDILQVARALTEVGEIFCRSIQSDPASYYLSWISRCDKYLKFQRHLSVNRTSITLYYHPKKQSISLLYGELLAVNIPSTPINKGSS